MMLDHYESRLSQDSIASFKQQSFVGTPLEDIELAVIDDRAL